MFENERYGVPRWLYRLTGRIPARPSVTLALTEPEGGSVTVNQEGGSMPTVPADPRIVRHLTPLIVSGAVCIQTWPMSDDPEDIRFVSGPFVALSGYTPEAPADELWVFDTENNEAIRVPREMVGVDMNDATGRAHAAWAFAAASFPVPGVDTAPFLGEEMSEAAIAAFCDVVIRHLGLKPSILSHV